MSMVRHHREIMAAGFPALVDDALGHLMVAHSGAITWDQLQAVKNAVWGPQTRAIEVYPRASDVVNNGQFRHLWRLGEDDFCPDLLKHERRNPPERDGLQHRHLMAWMESQEAFA